jgi:uncharacterized protein (TIGR02996 family)
MTDADALRRAVLDRPDDDTPRLAYADFLDETGEPDRAAFVRLQCEAARAEPDSPPARAAAEKAARLLAANSDHWTRELPRGVIRPEFVRGFVERVTFDVALFADTAPTVFAAEPIRAVKLLRVPALDEEPSFIPALTSPELARVTRLAIASPGLFPDPDEWAALTAPHLAGLRELSLHDTPITPSWLTDLLAGPALPNLDVLDLAGITNAGPAVAAGLAKARHRRLTGLNLTGVVFRSSDALRRLFMAKCLEGVEELRLAHIEGVRVSGPLADLNVGWVLPWRALRVLDVSGHQFGPEGVKEIARRPEAKHLRRLELRHNGFGPAGVAELVESPHLRLYHLDVRGNGLGPPELEALRKRFPDAAIEADPPRTVIRGR